MKLKFINIKGSGALLCALATVGVGTTAHALPDSSWDKLEDDTTVVVKGVSPNDFIYENKKAPNGSTRIDLTQGYIDYLMTVFEWTFQLKMSAGERDEFGQRLAKVWMSGKHDDNVPGAFNVMTHRSAFDQYSPDYFTDDWQHTIARNKQLTVLRQAAQTDKENGGWLLKIYDKYHPALAPGAPRLTRLTTDALSERVTFMINEIIGKKAATNNANLRDRVARDTAALWPKLSVARRNEILKMEEDWYYEKQKGWDYRDAASREEVRIAWGAELQGAFPSVKPMYLKRKAALDAAKAKQKALWAKMSPAQQQMLIGQMQQQFQMQATMNASMQAAQRDANTRAMNAQTAGHVARMNIIENMKSTPNRVYSTK